MGTERQKAPRSATLLTATRAAAALLGLFLGLTNGCTDSRAFDAASKAESGSNRGTIASAAASPSGELEPGLIDFELRGVSEEHGALGRSLGTVLDDEAVADSALDDLLQKSWEEEFLEVRTADVAHSLAVLRARPDIIYAEQEVELHALFTPNDPAFPKQWHLRAAGAQAAWDAVRGDGATVAVLDTGVSPLDDFDSSRILDGFNFITHSGGVAASSDDHFHGTHIAGTIAEATDNGVGAAGMAPHAKILPLKVLSAEGSGASGGIAEAIRYAADHGAQVINLSLGGGARSLALEFATAYAHRKGVTIIAAAGNTGARGVSYPAAYHHAVAVAAAGPTGQWAPYSTFGPEVAITAPGGDKSLGEEQSILQQTLDDQHQPAYRFLQGTSMATAHVSGAAALLVSAGVTSPDAIARLLRSTATTPSFVGMGDPVARAEHFGAGLLDAGAAVRRATTVWGIARFLLAILGALIALAHARKLQQIRSGESMSPAFWAALGLAAGVLAIAAPLGLARVPGLGVFALAPAAMPMRWLGAAGSSGFATAAAFLGWSALVPLLIAGVSKLAANESDVPSRSALGAVAGGVAFGQAGLLLQTAMVGAIHLPGLSPLVAAAWLALNAFVCWFAGRALLSRAARGA